MRSTTIHRRRTGKIYRHGRVRYSQRVPPGFADIEQKRFRGERSLFGDLILWEQTLKIAETQRKPVVFVSCEQKEDWRDKTGSTLLGPHPLLVQEMAQRTGQDLWVYGWTTLSANTSLRGGRSSLLNRLSDSLTSQSSRASLRRCVRSQYLISAFRAL